MTDPDPSEPARIRTARIDWTDDDVPRSRDFDDVYFSREDGLAETRHVFLDHNDLARRWSVLADGDDFVIGETGFGTGLNFLAAWQAWDEHAPAGARLHFLSAERHPLAPADLERALAAWPELALRATALAAAYPASLHRGVHRLNFDSGRVHLSLALGEALDALGGFLESRHPLHRVPRRGVDAWFLDGFAPSRNPELWRPELLAVLGELSAPDATFATYTAAGDVRRGLEAAGFSVRKAPGFGHKRELLHGERAMPAPAPNPADFPASPYPDGHPPAWDVHRTAERPGPRAHVAVVGGGLAGCHAARALAERGVTVTLLEAENALAAGGSGNDQGVLYARLSAHDTPAARFNLSALAFAERRYRSYWSCGGPELGAACGVLHLARDERDARQQQRLLDHHGTQSLFLGLDRAQASGRAGIDLPAGGLFFPGSGWLSPPALCRALADHPRIDVRQGRVARLNREDGDDGPWTLAGPDGGTLLEADRVVLACAGALADFPQTADLPVQPVRGQVSTLDLDAAPGAAALRVALCGDGYLAPATGGRFTFGASFLPDDTDTALRAAEHEENLRRLRAQAPGLIPQTTGAAQCAGRAALRCATRDRLPLVGPVPNAAALERDFALLRKNARAAIPASGRYLPGLYVSAGYGSRGLAYVPLATELLAADLLREPPPLDRALRRALNPARFVIRELVRNER